MPLFSSKGIIYDFLGFQINRKRMAFGNPRKYVKLKDINDIENFDDALQKANQ